MLASHPPPPSMVIDETTTVTSADYTPLYTIFLTNCDRSVVTDRDQISDEIEQQAPVNTMLQRRVTTWDLDEVGRIHFPACTHPSTFSDVEIYSWEDIWQVIKDHDWSPTRHNGVNTSPRINANNINRPLRINPGSPIQSYTTAVRSDERPATEVSAAFLLDDTERQDLDLTAQEHPSTTAVFEDNTASELATVSVAVLTLSVPDTRKSTIVTPQLQAASIEGSGHEPPNSTATALAEVIKESNIPCIDKIQDELPSQLMLHKEDAVWNYKRVESVDVIGGTIVTDCPATPALAHSDLCLPLIDSRIRQMEDMVIEDSAQYAASGDHYTTPTSDGEFGNVAGPADTVVIPTADIAANKVGQDLHHTRSSSGCFNDPEEITIDKSDRFAYKEGTNSATDQSREAGQQTQEETGDTHMIDVEGSCQDDAQSPMVIPDESLNHRTAEDAAVKSDEVQTIEIPAMLVDGPREHDASSPSEQAVDGNSHPHLNDSILDDESTPRSDCSKTAIDCGCDSQHDVTLSVVALNRPTTNEGKFIRGTCVTTKHPCSAFDGRGTQSLLQDLQMQEVAANGDGHESHSPAGDSEPVTPSHATLTEPTPESDPATVSLLSSIMTSLTNYPSSMSTCGDRAKRSHGCIEPRDGVDEESTTKRQKLDSSIKPESIEATSTDEVMNVGSSSSDVLEPGATEVLALRDVKKPHDGATTFGAQDEVGIEVEVDAEVEVETDGAMPSSRLKNDSAEAESEPYAGNIATLNTVMPTKEALHVIVQETAQTFHRRRSEDYHSRLSPEVLSKQLCGLYVQTTDVEMQERITTTSLSQTLASSISPLKLTSESCVPRLTLEPLKPPTTSHEPAKVEAVDFEMNEDEMDVSEPDELSDADDDQLSILSQAVNESSDQVNLQAKDSPALGDFLPAIKDSTPAPEAQAVKATESRPTSCTPCTNRSQTRLLSCLLSDEFEATLPPLPKPIARSTNRLLCNAPLAITDPTAKLTESPISPRPASTETLPSLRYELELPYGKRNTRSETKTSERAAASSTFREDELDSVPAPVVKEETPTAAPVKEITPSAPSKKRKNVLADESKGRQTRGATTKRDATPKPKTPAPRPKLTAKPRTGPEDSPNSAPKMTTKTTKRTAPKTKTPTRPQVSPITPAVPEKRKTRRSSALEEEIRKASEKEENIAKRTRSKDGE